MGLLREFGGGGPQVDYDRLYAKAQFAVNDAKRLGSGDPNQSIGAQVFTQCGPGDMISIRAVMEFAKEGGGTKGIDVTLVFTGQQTLGEALGILADVGYERAMKDKSKYPLANGVTKPDKIYLISACRN